MGTLDGRVAIITGAGRGVGPRARALLRPRGREGRRQRRRRRNRRRRQRQRAGAGARRRDRRARAARRSPTSTTPPTGTAPQRMVAQAVETSATSHVLVNNAGILRDRFIVSMSEEEWDAVVRVHLKGHFCVTRFAAEYWKGRAKRARRSARRSSTRRRRPACSANPGQINYGAAKAGIVMMTIVEALELGRYGVRVNAIAPVARTRLTEDVPMIGELLKRARRSARLRRVLAGQRLAARRLPRQRGLHADRAGLLDPRWADRALRGLGRGGVARARSPADGRRAWPRTCRRSASARSPRRCSRPSSCGSLPM